MCLYENFLYKKFINIIGKRLENIIEEFPNRK